MSTPKKGAPGDQPAPAPDAQSGAPDVRDAESGAGEAAPRRRRGNRGGRRHKKPAAAAAPPIETGQAQTTTPRDGYASAAGALADLPTAPLIPVGAAEARAARAEEQTSASRRAPVAREEGPASAGPDAQAAKSRSGRSRRKPKATESAATAGRAGDAVSPPTQTIPPAGETTPPVIEAAPATAESAGTGDGTSADGEGKTTASMQDIRTYLAAGWDFDTIWAICTGKDYPRLRWENISCEGSN